MPVHFSPFRDAILALLLLCSIPLHAHESLRLLQKTPDSPFADALVLSLMDFYDREGPDVVRALLAQARRIPGLSPEALHRTELLLMQLDLRQGNIPSVRKRLQQSGYLQNWRLFGPFSAEQHADLSEFADTLSSSAPSEFGSMCFPVLDRSICSFADLDNAEQYGRIRSDIVFFPLTDICVLAQSEVSLTQDTQVTLYFGAAGASEVFWNDTSLFRDTHYSSRPDPNRHRIDIQARQGDHVITVKNCSSHTGDLSFSARMTSPGNNEEISVRAPAGYRIQTNPQTLRFRHQSLLQQIRKQAVRDRAGEADVSAFLAYAYNTGAVDPSDTFIRDIQMSACQQFGTPAICLLAAEYGGPVNTRLDAIRRALRRYPGDVRLLASMVRLQREIPVLHLSRATLKSLIAKAPKDPDVLCLQLEDALHYGQEISVAKLAYSVMTTSPLPPFLQRCVARAKMKTPLDSHTLPFLTAALQWYADDTDMQLAAARLAAGMSRTAELANRLQMLDALQPLAHEQMFSLVELLQQQKRTKEADFLLTRACYQSPGNAECWKRLGQLRLHKSERKTDAYQAFRYAQRLNPHDPWLNMRVGSILPEERFEKPFVVKPSEFLRTRGTRALEDARVILQSTAIYVRPSGLSSRFEQTIVEIGTRDAADHWQQHSITYVPGEQQVTVLEARVFRADGTVEHATARGLFSLSKPWYRLYYDLSAEVVELPRLHPGDVVEFQFRVDDVSARNRFGSYFGDMACLHQYYPVDDWRYTVLASPEMHNMLTFSSSDEISSLEPVNTRQPIIVESDEQTQFRFHYRNIPRIPNEPGMTGRTSGMSCILVSTFSNWKALTRWYSNLIRNQFHSSEQIVQIATNLTAHQTNQREKVATLYQWLTENIRYVGLEFGIHSIKPYASPLVMARGFGDCKDSAALLVTMLRSVGIEADLILVRTRSAGSINNEVPTMRLFNHAIVNVPEIDVWLDGTAKFHGIDDYPFENQGVVALRVHPSTTDVFVTPFSAAENSILNGHMKFNVHKDGTSSLKASFSAFGPAYGPQIRNLMTPSHDRTRVLENQLSIHFPGIRIKKSMFSHLETPDKPIEWGYSAEIPSFGLISDNIMTMPAGPPMTTFSALTALVKRTHDLSLGPLSKQIHQIVIRIPDEYEVSSVPFSVFIEDDVASLRIATTILGDEIHISREFVRKQVVVKPGEYNALLKFSRNAEAALSRRIELRRK